MAEQQNPVISDSDVQRILSTIKEVESSGNYGAKAKGSSASGAYQFINDTWQRSTKRYGIGTEYKTAADAPPEVQDAVAARAVKDILGQVGGDVTKVPLVWYTGNPQGRITEEALKANQGLTPDKYQQKWLSVFNQGRPTATAQAQPQTRPPVQGTTVAAAVKPSLTDMPPAYRMALAANYLADTESPETSVVERAMEMLGEQQGGAAKNPMAGFVQTINQESLNPFQFVQQQEEEPRRPVPRMPVRMAEGGEAKANDVESQVKQMYLQNLGREADVGGLQYWTKEFGPEIDTAERLRFIEGAAPEVQQRLASGDKTLPAYMQVNPEVRRALASQDLTTDQYKTLANYFGNQWIAGEAEDPASLTRRDYIERPRSGYDLATFLATRSQQHGAQADTQQRMSNLLAPYMGNVGATSTVSDEGLGRYVVNPFTGQTEIANPLGVDNMYRIYRQPHQGTIGDPEKGSRYAVGLNYRVDPETGQATFVGPYTEYYKDMGHRDWQGPLGILGTAVGLHFFPGMDIGSMMTRGAITAATEGAKRMFKDGGMAESDTDRDLSEEDRRDMANRQMRIAEQGLSYAMGPMDIRAVRKPGGYEARVSSNFNQIVPYMDFDPLTGTFKPTEYGVSYGQMGPQGGYEIRAGQQTGRPGQPTPPPQITGQYRQQLDRNSEIQASGFYSPIHGAKDAYGANIRYMRRFEKGGDVNANPADVAEQMTVGTLPEDKGKSLLAKYLAFRQRKMEEPTKESFTLQDLPGANVIRGPGIFGPLGPVVGNYIAKKGYFPPTVHELLGYAPPGDVWDPEELKKMYGEKEVVRRQAGSPEEGEVAAQQMTVGTMLPPPEPPPPVPVVRPGVTIPTIREVPQVDAQGRVIREAPAPARAFTPGQQAVGAGEAVLSAVSGLTAPASIVYDLARGVPTKDVSPGRFMYEPRTEAGQEMLQDVGRLAQQYKLDVALPQVQLQRPYPVGAAVRQGIASLEKGVEKMTLPAFRQITGNPNATKEEMMDFVLNQKNIMQAGAPAAVKPGGGVVNADEMIDSLTNVLRFDVKAEGQKFDDIFKWIDTKARSYYEKQFGSPSDPLFRAFMSGDFDPQFNHINDTVRETYENSIKHGRDLMSSTSTANQRIGRAILSDIYDKVTPVVAQYGPQTIRNRLLNPKFREEIQRYIMEERNLGPAKLTPKARLNYEKEIDSYLDEFAKTGNLSTKAPFDVVDINKAASQNIVDDIGNKIELQTKKTFNLQPDEMHGFVRQWPGYGTALEKTHALPSAYSKNYPDYLATTAERQAVKFGEPTYFISKEPEEVHADLSNLIGYLNRTPADEWKNTSFPDLVVKAQKDYSNITDPQEIYKRLNNYQKVTPKQRLIGTQEFMPVESKQLGEGATWRELDENGILIEGRLLRHCLSEDEKYRNFYKDGMSRFFALRDKEGKSYATIQIDRLGMDGPFANVHQIKGWKNDSVGKKYDKELMDFLNRYEANEINVPLRYTEEIDWLPESIRKAPTRRIAVHEDDSPLVRRYADFFRNLDRRLLEEDRATAEDLGDFNYVLDEMRRLPSDQAREDYALNFLRAFGEGFNMDPQELRAYGYFREGDNIPGGIQPRPLNKGGMVDKPLYDRAA